MRVAPRASGSSGETGRVTTEELRADEVLALAWCANVWCGQVYGLDDGWGGRCPSCLALEDEHLAGTHTLLIEVCAECRREPPAPSYARLGGRGRK